MGKRSVRRIVDRKPSPAQVEKARRELADKGFVLPKPDDPELGAFLEDILVELRIAESVAETAGLALRATSVDEMSSIETTLRLACTDRLTEQIRRMEEGMQRVRLHGRRLIVNSNVEVQS